MATVRSAGFGDWNQPRRAVERGAASAAAAVLAAVFLTVMPAAQADIIFSGGAGQPMTLQFTSPLNFTITSVPSSPSYILIIEDAYLSGMLSNTGSFTNSSGRPTINYLTTSSNAVDVRAGIAGGVIANTDVVVNFASLSPSSPTVSSTVTISTGTATTSTAMTSQLPNNLGLRNVFLADFSSAQQRSNVLQTTISVVPEPTTLAMVLPGLVGGAAVFRRRASHKRSPRRAD